MHKQQLRGLAEQSPADLAAYLAVLAEQGINIIAAGGGDVENGGEFAFAVEHGNEDAAMAALMDAGYRPRLVDIDYCAISNRPGELLECIQGVRTKNEGTGRVIRDISVGVPDEEGRIQVQIYSE